MKKMYNDIPDAGPILSVVIPALNIDTELRRCVDSIRVACPDYDLCEVIVVVPPTRLDAAIEMFPHESVVPESRPSIYTAMNDGISASTGKFLYFSGKDDIVLPALSEAISILKKSSPSALFCDVYWGDDGIYRGKPSKWKVLIRNFCHQGIIYSREVLNAHGPYNRKMRVQADHLLNIKILWDDRFNKNCIYHKKPLAWYAATGYSSFASDGLFWKIYPLILKRYVNTGMFFLIIIYRNVKKVFK